MSLGLILELWTVEAYYKPKKISELLRIITHPCKCYLDIQYVHFSISKVISPAKTNNNLQ
jgi:hypothetical protein